MTEVDNRYITVFGYNLAGAIIERIRLYQSGIDLYLSTHRMDIPENAPSHRNDGSYLLSFRNVEALATDFPLAGEEVERLLATEGNEIHDYGFSDENLVEGQPADAITVYFDTDWGLLEVAALSVMYSL